MKSYTNLEQSKKIMEFLSFESADMDYIPVVNIDGEYSISVNIWDNDHVIEDGWIPCWSLDALLDILPYPTLAQHANGLWSLTVWVGTVEPYSVGGYNNKIDTCVAYSVGGYNNKIDACVDMIIKLHELNLL